MILNNNNRYFYRLITHDNLHSKEINTDFWQKAEKFNVSDRWDGEHLSLTSEVLRI